MADTDTSTEIAQLPPDTLVDEIERTRAELAQTIDQISDKLSPSANARRVADRLRDRACQIDPRLGIAAGVAAAGVAAFLIWQRVRR